LPHTPRSLLTEPGCFRLRHGQPSAMTRFCKQGPGSVWQQRTAGSVQAMERQHIAGSKCVLLTVRIAVWPAQVKSQQTCWQPWHLLAAIAAAPPAAAVNTQTARWHLLNYPVTTLPEQQQLQLGQVRRPPPQQQQQQQLAATGGAAVSSSSRRSSNWRLTGTRK
jgi:hypothetical protein